MISDNLGDRSSFGCQSVNHCHSRWPNQWLRQVNSRVCANISHRYRQCVLTSDDVGLYHSVIISYLSYRRTLKILRLYNMFFLRLIYEICWSSSAKVTGTPDQHQQGLRSLIDAVVQFNSIKITYSTLLFVQIPSSHFCILFDLEFRSLPFIIHTISSSHVLSLSECRFNRILRIYGNHSLTQNVHRSPKSGIHLIRSSLFP